MAFRDYAATKASQLWWGQALAGAGCSSGDLLPMCYLGPIFRIQEVSQTIDFIGEPGGNRTRDHMIKSHVLYP